MIGSYFIELSIARVFWEKAVKSESITSLSYGVALAFWAVRHAVTKGDLSVVGRECAVGLAGDPLAGQHILLTSDTDLACAAWEDEKAGRNASAAAKWKRVFGDKFPD